MVTQRPLPPLSREESLILAKRRRGKNLAMLVVLFAVAALFYAITVVKFHSSVAG